MKRHVITITSDTTGVATGNTDDTVNGRILSIQYEGTAPSTAIDITVTTLDSSQTILVASNVTGPKRFAPRQPVHKSADGVELIFSATPGGSAAYDYMYATNEKIKVSVVQAGDAVPLRFCIITDG